MTHPVLDRAREMLEKYAAAEWQFAAEHAERDPTAECPLERWRRLREQYEPTPPQQQQSTGDAEMVYKTFETPASQPSEPEYDWSTLNAWLKMNVENALDKFGEAVVKYVAEDRRTTREEIGSLRVEVEVLRSVIKSQNVGILTRSRDVA